MGSTKYTYDLAPSPWSKELLFISWSFQTFYTVLLTTITGALTLNGTDNYGYGKFQWAYDDGVFQAISLVLFACLASFTGIQIIFFVLQIIRYRQNRLHPKRVLIMAICSMILWLAVFSLAIVAVAAPWAVWNGISLLVLFDGSIVIPATVHLIYAIRVYRRYRNAEKSIKPIDVENQESERIVDK